MLRHHVTGLEIATEHSMPVSHINIRGQTVRSYRLLVSGFKARGTGSPHAFLAPENAIDVRSSSAARRRAAVSPSRYHQVAKPSDVA